MRWLLQLSYLGTHYCGWQRQPNAVSVQQVIEEAMSMILRQEVTLTGCGRTDTGVHARTYIAHTDIKEIHEPTDKLLYHLNAVLPGDIAIQSFKPVPDHFHARFDAIRRGYTYHLHSNKDPFRQGQSFYFPQAVVLDQDLMHQAAGLLLRYDQFQPFCKTGSDADHYRCHLMASAWTFEKDTAVYHVQANRFLRGMVRLIVGACLNVGLGKVSLDELKSSLDRQQPVPHAWSVPPEGLYLDEVVYPETALS